MPVFDHLEKFDRIELTKFYSLLLLREKLNHINLLKVIIMEQSVRDILQCLQKRRGAGFRDYD